MLSVFVKLLYQKRVKLAKKNNTINLIDKDRCGKRYCSAVFLQIVQKLFLNTVIKYTNLYPTKVLVPQGSAFKWIL